VEESIPSDSGYVVEWQMADGAETVIDLSNTEAQTCQSEPATVPPSTMVSTAR
jgi:hypothetical protein